ncbi:MAG: hypothetical protein QOI36_5942 [Pseudonocardiales bacterium]|jgi:hypothetical protein|nr:hypothetical protein [Pseudonocardiales bacterium]
MGKFRPLPARRKVEAPKPKPEPRRDPKGKR